MNHVDPIELPQCTLCEHAADPRHGLMTKNGDYYPLCDGCAPYPDGMAEAARGTADLCRMSGKRPCAPLSRFGHNEPKDST